MQLWGIELSSLRKKKLVVPPNAGDTEENLSLEEKVAIITQLCVLLDPHWHILHAKMFGTTYESDLVHQCAQLLTINTHLRFGVLQLRRERQRVHAIGVTSYLWSGRNSAKARYCSEVDGLMLPIHLCQHARLTLTMEYRHNC
jgi:hypothetical protein